MSDHPIFERAPRVTVTNPSHAGPSNIRFDSPRRKLQTSTVSIVMGLTALSTCVALYDLVLLASGFS